MLDAARQRFMHHQQAVREAEINRLDQEVQKRVVQREEETKHVLEDVETRALELERQKALLEQELAKCQEEVSTWCVCSWLVLSCILLYYVMVYMF